MDRRFYPWLAVCTCLAACHSRGTDVLRDPSVSRELRSLGFPAMIEDRDIIPGSDPPVEFVVFRAPGAPVCARYVDTPECADNSYDGDIVHWRAQEFLGLALLTTTNPPRVLAHRIVQEPMPLWSGGFVSEPRGTPGKPPKSSDRGEQHLISIDDVADLDGDGETEFIVGLVNSVLVATEDGVVPAIARGRLLIVRPDLSLQLDVETGQSVLDLLEGALNEEDDIDGENDFVRGDDGSLAFRWCVLDASQARVCPSSVLCEHPSHEAVLRYDPATDTYMPERMTKFERVINLEDPRCEGTDHDEDADHEEEG